MSRNQNIPSHLRIALESIDAFTSDNSINIEELNSLLAIAEEDGQIDNEEARVLSNILKRALEGEVDAATVARIKIISEVIMRRDD